MPQGERAKKVVYLFGAGATHAELAALDPTLLEKNRGLLIGDVSERVIAKVRRNARYAKGVGMVSGTSGSLNIELLISLIENSKIEDWEFKTQFLKKLVREDIEKILTTARMKHFYIHKALFEFHKHSTVRRSERLIGLISLNYDDVLDRSYKAFEAHYGAPDYSFTLERQQQMPNQIPLLKLHGSFSWRGLTIRGRIKNVEIIPLGANKNYIHPPYNSIWNRALEVLIECDTLRVIGCSLSQNDVHLIDLLFKAHLEKGRPFDIEIISQEETGETIRRNYGFFPHIKTLTQIEGSFNPGSKLRQSLSNLAEVQEH